MGVLCWHTLGMQSDCQEGRALQAILLWFTLIRCPPCPPSHPLPTLSHSYLTFVTAHFCLVQVGWLHCSRVGCPALVSASDLRQATRAPSLLQEVFWLGPGCPSGLAPFWLRQVWASFPDSLADKGSSRVILASGSTSSSGSNARHVPLHSWPLGCFLLCGHWAVLQSGPSSSGCGAAAMPVVAQPPGLWHCSKLGRDLSHRTYHNTFNLVFMSSFSPGLSRVSSIFFCYAVDEYNVNLGIFFSQHFCYCTSDIYCGVD